MNTIIDILKSKRMNDRRGVQKALREIDTSILAIALSPVSPELRETLFKNMTVRSRAAIEKEIALVTTAQRYYFQFKGMTLEKAQAMCAEVLVNFTRDDLETETVYPRERPEVRLASFQDVVDTFERIGIHAYRHGLMALDGIDQLTEDVFFQKAIQMLLDGYEPLLFEQMLENCKERALQSYAVKLTMISEGVKSLQMGNSPFAIREKLSVLSFE